MAQSLQTVNLVAPGFKGINTEESPLAIDPNFAAIADNCVIDRYGRIASRRGFEVLSDTVTALNGEPVESIGVYRDSLGNTEVITCGNNKIMSGVQELTDITPAGYTVEGNNWDIVNFNDNLYLFQRGHEPLVYDGTDLGLMSDQSGATVDPPQGNAVLAAWGRLWTADFEEDKSTVYWSDLLLGSQWTGGSSGSIDIAGVWPDGYDEVQALAAHNNLLVIFGKHSIVVYEGADSPSSMTLSDTVSGTGTVGRETIEYTGTDLLFVSYEGLRSFGRTIQEKSMPMTDLSLNVKQDFLRTLQAETEPLRTVYYPERSFMAVLFPSQDLAYVFDTRGTLENGSYRTTRWVDYRVKSFYRDVTGIMYTGSVDGLGQYAGFLDNTDGYLMKYYSPNLTFNQPAVLKILKKIKPTIIGGSGSLVRFRWGYDFSGNFKTYTANLLSAEISEFGLDEYNEAVYSNGVISKILNINTSGNGTSVIVGLEAEIQGSALSLQEYNIWTMIGKMV